VGEAYVRTVTMKEFRRLDSLSGQLRVVSGSRRRRGARRLRRASCLPAQASNSPVVPPDADETNATAAGGSAHTSAAHAASLATDAAPAKPKAELSPRAPILNSAAQIRLWFADEPATQPATSAKPNETKESAKPQVEKQKGKNKTEPATGSGEGSGPKIESLWDERAHLDGGDDLPLDGPGFVDAVNEYVDLVRLTDSLLRERDEKSSKSLLEKLLEMKYGKCSKGDTSGVRPIINDLPGPIRD
jgi:hypothetical protein